MAKELEAEAPGAVRVIGIDAVGQQSANALMVAGRTLPWLQDSVEVDAWGKWKATWRDVIVLDASGQRRAVYNLTEHDLADAPTFQALKTILLDAR